MSAISAAKAGQCWHLHRTFFGRFSYVQELIAANYCAFDPGMQLLYRCQTVAPDAYARVHNGTPFDWLGTAAFQKHDYEIAVFFFDAACPKTSELALTLSTTRHPQFVSS